MDLLLFNQEDRKYVFAIISINCGQRRNFWTSIKDKKIKTRYSAFIWKNFHFQKWAKDKESCLSFWWHFFLWQISKEMGITWTHDKTCRIFIGEIYCVWYHPVTLWTYIYIYIYIYIYCVTPNKTLRKHFEECFYIYYDVSLCMSFIKW